MKTKKSLRATSNWSNGLGPIVHVDAIVSCLFLVGACSAFCSLGWVVMVYLLLLAVWLGLVMSAGLRGFAHVAAVVLLGMKCILSLSVLPLLLCGRDMPAFSLVSLTPCDLFSPSRIIWGYFTTS